MFTLVTKNVIIGLSIKPVSLKIEVRTDIITISKKTMIFELPGLIREPGKQSIQKLCVLIVSNFILN